MNYYISDTEYYLPKKRVDNDYFVNECGIERDFLENKVGIGQRFFAEDDETVADMAVSASEKLFENTKMNRDEIDLIVLVTENPDYKIPTTACLVQDRLGLPQSVKAFDITMGCSGYIYGIVTAGAYIKSGMSQCALVITSDQYSKILDYTDRGTGPIFGDAAAASIVRPCEDGYGVIDANFGTDGGKSKFLYLPNSGLKKDPDTNDLLYMNGREIFKFVLRTVPPSINALLDQNEMTLEDLKYVIYHQANAYMIGRLREQMGVTDAQYVLDLKDYGNTIASTIPIALKNLIDKGKLNRDDLYLMSGFGVGLSWGNILYREL